MGLVRTKITLKNVEDQIWAKEGLIKKEEIRQTTVNALVDTGSWTLVINETVRKKLGLDLKGLVPAVLLLRKSPIKTNGSAFIEGASGSIYRQKKPV